MPPKIIAHRALLNGPNKEIENRFDTIKTALEKGFDVEVDVWVKYKGETGQSYSDAQDDLEWWLGHDGPQYKTDLEFLKSFSTRAYFHAKNGNALFELLKLCRDPSLNFKCFFHDIDEYTITSDQKIWAYPGKKLFAGREDCICVMPERWPVQDNMSKCFGICTDFSELYSIYQEMRTRQESGVASGKSVFDNQILPEKLDTRLCLALYTFYDDFSPSSGWNDFYSHLKSEYALQNVYAVEQEAQNVLHHTIMQVLGFDEYPDRVDEFVKNEQQYVDIIRQVLREFLPFKIEFRGCIAIQSGLILTGYPSIDINSTVRAKLYQKLDEAGLYYRKYMNNIVHSTIVRLSRDDDAGVGNRLLSTAEKYRDTYFGTVNVKAFHLGHSSWRMQTSELKEIDVFAVTAKEQ